MKKSTHSKIKNIGLIFELLTRQMIKDTIEGNSNSKAQRILHESFGKKSLLSKELELYTVLNESKSMTESKAHYLIDASIAAHSKLPIKELRRERYNLIKRINESYDVDFFKCHIPGYKTLASVYRLFDAAHSSTDPQKLVESRFTVVENLLKEKVKFQTPEVTSTEEKDINSLAYKLMIEKFNQKYEGLSTDQKEVIRQYIQNVSNTSALRQYIIDTANALAPRYVSKIKLISDPATKVKLSEMSHLANKLTTIKFATDDHVQSLLLHMELLKEIS